MRTFAFLLTLLIGVTQLSGCITTAVVGGAAVGSQIAVDRRTSGIYIEDENIEIKASNRLRQQLDENSKVNVTSFNGIVLLAGEAVSAEDKAKAETVVKTIPHIRTIHNEVEIMDKASLRQHSSDTYLTSKIKAIFVKDYVSNQRFNPSHVKIVSEHDIVYLMGLVTKDEAEAATQLARNAEGVKKVVKLFEYLPKALSK